MKVGHDHVCKKWVCCPMYIKKTICNSYTISMRVVWDLLPEPEEEGGARGRSNKSHAAQGGCGITILQPTMATHLHYYSNVSFNDVI